MKVVDINEKSTKKAKATKPKTKKESTKEVTDAVAQQMRDLGLSEQEIEEALLKDKKRIEDFDALYTEIESKFPNAVRFDQHDNVKKTSPFIDECLRRLEKKFIVPAFIPDRMKEVQKHFEGKFFTRQLVKNAFLVEPDEILKNLEHLVDIGIVAVEYFGNVKHYAFPPPVSMFYNITQRIDYYHTMLQLATRAKDMLIDESLELEVLEAGMHHYRNAIEEDRNKRIQNGKESTSQAD